MKTGITRAVTPEKTMRFEEHVKMCAIEAMNKHETAKDLYDEPLEVYIECIFPCPKSSYRKTQPRMLEWRTKKPDADNLAKAILDALNGIVYNDDSQVVNLHVKKLQGSQGQAPRTDVRIMVINENPYALPF